MNGLQINLLQITRTLEGINFPSSREDLIRHAEEKGADQGVIDALRELPDKLYNTAEEVNEMLTQSK